MIPRDSQPWATHPLNPIVIVIAIVIVIVIAVNHGLKKIMNPYIIIITIIIVIIRPLLKKD